MSKPLESKTHDKRGRSTFTHDAKPLMVVAFTISVVIIFIAVKLQATRRKGAKCMSSGP